MHPLSKCRRSFLADNYRMIYFGNGNIDQQLYFFESFKTFYVIDIDDILAVYPERKWYRLILLPAHLMFYRKYIFLNNYRLHTRVCFGYTLKQHLPSRKAIFSMPFFTSSLVFFLWLTNFKRFSTGTFALV